MLLTSKYGPDLKNIFTSIASECLRNGSQRSKSKPTFSGEGNLSHPLGTLSQFVFEVVKFWFFA